MTALILQRASFATVVCAVISLAGSLALAQNVGGDIGGGIFRPKNPEIKRSTGKTPKPITKPSRNTPKRNPTAELESRVEDLLGKGNDARDAKKYDEAQSAYEEVLKLKARDARAAYGLGNVFTDQRRWEDAERNYRDASHLGSEQR